MFNIIINIIFSIILLLLFSYVNGSGGRVRIHYSDPFPRRRVVVVVVFGLRRWLAAARTGPGGEEGRARVMRLGPKRDDGDGRTCGSRQSVIRAPDRTQSPSLSRPISLLCDFPKYCRRRHIFSYSTTTKLTLFIVFAVEFRTGNTCASVRPPKRRKISFFFFFFTKNAMRIRPFVVEKY